MSTRYYQPLFLEDKTGLLTGSEFTDIHDRTKFAYRRVRADSRASLYSIYELSSPRDDAYTRPVVTIEFSGGDTGAITLAGEKHSLERYIPRFGGGGHGSGYGARTFVGRNGRSYVWQHRSHEDHEWTCVDASDNTVVAFYHLKAAGEPQYVESSGCMLTVEELYADMASEFLATCMIMRHFATQGYQ